MHEKWLRENVEQLLRHFCDGAHKDDLRKQLLAQVGLI